MNTRARSEPIPFPDSSASSDLGALAFSRIPSGSAPATGPDLSPRRQDQKRQKSPEWGIVRLLMNPLEILKSLDHFVDVDMDVNVNVVLDADVVAVVCLYATTQRRSDETSQHRDDTLKELAPVRRMPRNSVDAR